MNHYDREWLLTELTPWDNDEGGDTLVDDTPDTGEEDGGGDENHGGGDLIPKAGDKDENGRVFTQEEVNLMVAKRNKSLKNEYEKLEKTYQDLLKQTNLSQEQREGLEKQLENVQAQMMTKEEQAKREKKKVEERFGKELKDANDRADKYQQLFERSTIERAIVDAAAAEDAFNTQLFISVLGPHAKIVDALDSEGNPTGNLVPAIDWQIKNEDGKTETVRLEPTEVVKLMRDDQDQYGGMFRSNVAPGIGQGTNPSDKANSGKVDPRKISAEEYMKLASTPEGRKALGLTK